jgi:cytochrome d ubiquinol oxidase subunit II
MFTVQGGIYLLLKTDGALHDRIARTVPRLMIAFFVLNTLVVIAMVLYQQQITKRYIDDVWPVVFPAAALVALGGAWVSVHRDQAFRAFICFSATIALLLVSGGIGLYPNLIVSTIDPANSLTIFSAASADNTLEVALIIAVIGMPFVLLYTAGVYYIFRGKTEVEPHGY